MKTDNIHIVGGGIVGLCSAWYLHRAGCTVTVVDRGEMTDGTSFGNAGMIVPSHFVPMATPGVIAQGLKWMLDRKSPFYIKPRLDVDLIQWLWHFYRAANPRQVDRSIPVLFELNERSKHLYKALATEHDLDFAFAERGLLMLYKTHAQAAEEAELAEQAHRLGVAADIFDRAGLKTLEPEMELDVLGGIYFPGDAHLYPNRLMQQLRRRLSAAGVTFLPNTGIVDFKTSGTKIVGLQTADNAILPVKNVLMASGSWSARLLKKVELKIHLQDGKGYSITLENPPLRPRIPTILAEAKVAITPMGNDLRIGGTLELSGLSPRIDPKRVLGIIESVPRYYRNLEVPFDDTTEVWKGYRPCTPDGLPYIGPSQRLTNLHVGTGHGMMGLSLGAITGKLLSEMITGQPPSIAPEPFRLDRF